MDRPAHVQVLGPPMERTIRPEDNLMQKTDPSILYLYFVAWPVSSESAASVAVRVSITAAPRMRRSALSPGSTESARSAAFSETVAPPPSLVCMWVLRVQRRPLWFLSGRSCSAFVFCFAVPLTNLVVFATEVTDRKHPRLLCGAERRNSLS